MKLGLSLVVSSLIALGQVAAHGHERSMHPREIASRQVHLFPVAFLQHL